MYGHYFIPNCAKFYALPKIYKSTLAFFLIVSNVDNASYKLVLSLSQSLTHLTCSTFYTVKNSYDFAGKFKHIFPSNYAMLSLDICDGYANLAGAIEA